MWKNEKFSLTNKIFRQINSLVTYSVKQLFSRNFWQKCVRKNFRNFHTLWWDTAWKSTVLETQNGNHEIFLPRFFCKNSVKVTVLLVNYILNWFDEKKFAWQGSEFVFFPHCEDANTLKNFRETNYFERTLIWQKNVNLSVKTEIVFLTTFLCEREILSFFHILLRS